MNPTAELTLRIISYLGDRSEAPSSPARWTFVPGKQRLSFVEAAEWLDAQPKPLLIGDLQERGFIGVWQAGEIDDNARGHLQHDVVSQQKLLEHSLDNLDDDATVLFETGADQMLISAGDLRRWGAEYRMTCGLGCVTGTEATHRAKFRVRRADGRWSTPLACPV